MFDVEINPRCRSIQRHVLAVHLHFKFRHARPLQSAHRLRRFLNCILRRLREALFRYTHHINYFLRHDFSLSRRPSSPHETGGNTTTVRSPRVTLTNPANSARTIYIQELGMPDFRKLTLLLLSLSIATGCSRHTTDVRQSLAQAAQLQGTEGSPRLLAAYQPWFGEPKHINVGYSSHDPNVLARQVSEAKGLGIDAFVVNWYGPRKQFEDQSYALLQQAASQNSFQTAIMYDEDTEYVGQNTEAVLVDLQYAYDRYIGPHAVASRSAYLRFNGRPMIFIFPKSGGTDWTRVREVVNSWEDPPLLIFKDINTHYPNAFDGFYAWVQPGRVGWQRDGSNWGEQYLQDFYTRMSSQYPNKIAVGAAWPGFNDTRAVLVAEPSHERSLRSHLRRIRPPLPTLLQRQPPTPLLDDRDLERLRGRHRDRTRHKRVQQYRQHAVRRRVGPIAFALLESPHDAR